LADEAMKSCICQVGQIRQDQARLALYAVPFTSSCVARHVLWCRRSCQVRTWMEAYHAEREGGCSTRNGSCSFSRIRDFCAAVKAGQTPFAESTGIVPRVQRRMHRKIAPKPSGTISMTAPRMGSSHPVSAPKRSTIPPTAWRVLAVRPAPILGPWASLARFGSGTLGQRAQPFGSH
jgi:hypothetical protein